MQNYINAHSSVGSVIYLSGDSVKLGGFGICINESHENLNELPHGPICEFICISLCICLPTRK